MSVLGKNKSNFIICTILLSALNLQAQEHEKKTTKWQPLEKNKTIDGYTKLDGKLYCGEAKCDPKPMSGVDVQSFVVFKGSGYAKDMNYVYYPTRMTCIDYTNCGVCYCETYIIENANPKEFVYLEKGYAKDNESVYYKGKLIIGADARSFKVLKGPKAFIFSIDRYRVYFRNKVFKKADPKTFRFWKIGKKYGNKNWFYEVMLLKDVDNTWELKPPNTITIVNDK